MILAVAALAACVPVATDGDSLRCGAERIRLAAIDAPELPGSARCNRPPTGANPPWCDTALAYQSRDALAAFLRTGPVVIERCGLDRYQRTLARVSVNGIDAARWLISRGLARAWQGRTGCE